MTLLLQSDRALASALRDSRRHPTESNSEIVP
jgi:hypothetical protein